MSALNVVPDHDEPGRRVVLTPASSISMQPVRWLWDKRIPLGSVTLLAGREGIGKSTAAAAIAAQVTRGTLSGHFGGEPRSVLVAATEDSWAHTLVPRFVAAGADLTRVFRIDVAADGMPVALTLPRDVDELTDAARSVDASLLLLDPLMSRLSASLDTHRDAEVRQALEPLVRAADGSGLAVVGLIHLSKSGTTDALTSVMGSRAFTAVARAVLFTAVDPDDESTRLLGLAKSNLGPLDQPTLAFRVEGAKVADTSEGPVFAGRVVWLGERPQTVRELMEAAGDTADTRTAVSEAGGWLADHLASMGGSDESAAIKAAGRRAGHSEDALKRARRRLGIVATSCGFPRRTYWALPEPSQSEQDSGRSPGETHLSAPTNSTEQVGAVGAVSAVGEGPRARGGAS